MSGDEVFALIVCLALGVFGWKDWLGGLFAYRPINPEPGTPPMAALAPLLSGTLMLFVLCQWASHDVRSDFVYIAFYLVFWFGWTGALLRFFPYAGLSARDDMLERRNAAASLAIGGALIGFTLAFSGGNIGDGPGWWVVLFSSGLATASLLGLWMVGNLVSRTEEAISIDRDRAAGWRTLGFFVGGGLVVGRAAAGNWQSAGATLADFVAHGWPVLIVWGAAVLLDVALRPTPAHPVRPVFSCGLVPAALLIATGLMAAVLQGAW